MLLTSFGQPLKGWGVSDNALGQSGEAVSVPNWVKDRINCGMDQPEDSVFVTFFHPLESAVGIAQAKQ